MPWQKLTTDLSTFVDKKYLPEGCPFKDPSKLKQENVTEIIMHWRSRELRKKIPFRFKSCLAGHRRKNKRKSQRHQISSSDLDQNDGEEDDMREEDDMEETGDMEREDDMEEEADVEEDDEMEENEMGQEMDEVEEIHERNSEEEIGNGNGEEVNDDGNGEKNGNEDNENGNDENEEMVDDG